MSDEIQRLEEKIAYLEHHVTQQDKAMLEFSDAIERLRREMALLAIRLAPGMEGRAGNTPPPEEERPPHY